MNTIAELYGYTDVDGYLSRQEVIRVLAGHNVPLSDFDSEHEVAEQYDSDVVLAWLGY